MKVTSRIAFLVLTALLLSVVLLSAASASDAVDAYYLLQGMENIVPVEHTRYLLVQAPYTHLWGVYDTDGDLLIEEQFDSLAYLGYDCFETGPYLDPLWNWKGLVGPDGSLLSECVYGVIQVYNEYWAAGLQVDAGTAEAYDISLDGQYYLLDRCDIFWLGDDPGMVAQLHQEAFRQAAAHGKYLSVEAPSGSVTVYDSNFEPVKGFKAKSLKDSVYGVVNYTLADRITGEIIMDGVTASTEIQTASGLLFQVTRVHYSGEKLIGICNLNGEWLMQPGSYAVDSVDADYAVVSRDGLQGLYSFDEERLLLPCEYDSILSSDLTVDPYVFYGYVCGVKDGVRNYIDVNTGETVSTLEYDSDTMKSLGGTVYREVITDLFKITSADGTVWYMQNSQMPSVRGDGRLITFYSMDNWGYGVMTMDGSVALRFWYSTMPLITDDGKVVMKNGNNGYALIEMVW